VKEAKSKQRPADLKSASQIAALTFRSGEPKYATEDPNYRIIRRNSTSKPPAKIEAAYHRADAAIQDLIR
jgi:hypothetical protein